MSRLSQNKQVTTLAQLLLMVLSILLLAACGNTVRPIGPSAVEQATSSAAPVMAARSYAVSSSPAPMPISSVRWNTEEYGHIKANRFKDPVQTPVSTFSVDVDTAAYANVRRLLKDGDWPLPADAVRVEELINYFSYDYPEPDGDAPVSIIQELADCPWNSKNQLLHVGLKTKSLELEELPPNNLVFLLDVSGSMGSSDKLPLLKKALKMLARQMRAEDRVAIVVYAGASGVVLEPTPGNETEKINAALDQLEAGGSTAGGQGLVMAYELASKNFNPEGNNRVILATDGDFNVGVSSDGELIRMIEKKRESGIALTVLGFGRGNLKDAKMEQLADHGDGNYAYIDSLLEARKVLVEEMGSTLLTVAKDVKIQVEFNPSKVKSYRLIGYENRLLNAEDFDDDTKDAGEMGAGHTVTALYEIVPRSEGANDASTLRYQSQEITSDAAAADETAFVKFRYKRPGEKQSQLISVAVPGQASALADSSENFRFAAAVAEWAMLLKDSAYKGEASYENLIERIKGAKGADKQGLRGEFLQLVTLSQYLENE